MSFGQIRQRLPRARLALPGRDGPVSVEFVVDTGFDGELAVPPDVARRLDVEVAGRQSLALADGTVIVSPYYRMSLEWEEEDRLTEVLLLDGAPLLGVQLIEGYWLHSQMTTGGEVDIEPL